MVNSSIIMENSLRALIMRLIIARRATITSRTVLKTVNTNKRLAMTRVNVDSPFGRLVWARYRLLPPSSGLVLDRPLLALISESCLVFSTHTTIHSVTKTIKSEQYRLLINLSVMKHNILQDMMI